MLSLLLCSDAYTAGSYLKGTFMDIFAQFATDPKLELEGVWTEIGPRSDENDPLTAPAILVARNGNRRYGRILSGLYESNKSILEGKNEAADARAEQITIQAMSQALLLDWRNLEFRGELMTYGNEAGRIETAKKLLAVKDFRDLVMKTASDFNKYKVAQEQAEAKN